MCDLTPPSDVSRPLYIGLHPNGTATAGYLGHRQALLRLHQPLASAAPPLTAGSERLRRCEALRGFRHVLHPACGAVRVCPALEVHGEVQEGVESVAAVAALVALELVRRGRARTNRTSTGDVRGLS